jgi:TonB family protein
MKFSIDLPFFVSWIVGIGALIIAPCSGCAQTTEGDVIVVTVHDIWTEAAFPGGTLAMRKFINAHLQYPKDARKARIEGTVVLKFIVEVDGSVTNIQVEKSLCNSCDEEAIRVLSLCKFHPAKKNGIAERSRLNLPIPFILP